MISDFPFVSVIMPIRNEASFIERSLGAVIAQDYPCHRMEIIVADGMSRDNTREIVQSLQQNCNRLHLIENHREIVSTGLNTAINYASGEIIVRVDGHCEIAHDYVRQCVDHLQTEDVGGVGGSWEIVGETKIAKIIAIATSSTFGVGDSGYRTVKGRSILVDNIAFPAYTRAIIEQAGPFDEELVRDQDDEYNHRLRKLGIKLLLAADIHVRYFSRSSLRALWKQYYQYGFWKVRVMQKHFLQMRPRHFIPSLFVGSLFVFSMITLIYPIGHIFFTLLCGFYILANLSASFWEARKSVWWYFFLMPLIFAILHLSYGIGFIIGLIWFCNRWGDKRTFLYDTVGFSNEGVWK